MERYPTRLRRQSLAEFRTFWSASRNWVSAVGLFASPTVIQCVGAGWKNIPAIGEAVMDGLIGVIVSLCGTGLIALWKGAKTLDADLHSRIAKLEDLHRNLGAKPTRSAAEEHYYQVARTELANVSEQSKAVLRHSWEHGRLEAGLQLNVPDLHAGQIMNLLNGELSRVSFIRKREEHGYNIWWEPVPAYTDVVEDLLYASS
jgi:hypothetical protein